MREDIRIKKYMDIYKKVGTLYEDEFLSVRKSCDKIGITDTHYYRICNVLGKKSVASEDKKPKTRKSKDQKTKNKKPKDLKPKDQKGGNKNIKPKDQKPKDQKGGNKNITNMLEEEDDDNDNGNTAEFQKLKDHFSISRPK
jgi:hypothetical protein